MTRIVNLTPHPIVLTDPKTGNRSPLPGAPKPARIVEATTPAAPLALGDLELPVSAVSYTKEVSNLPAPAEGTIYVVSRIVCEALPERTDLYFPFDLIRDEDNVVIGCSGLGRMA